MENLLTILVVALLIAVIVLIGLIAYFGHRFLKIREAENNKATEIKEADRHNKREADRVVQSVTDTHNSSTAVAKENIVDPKLLTSLRAKEALPSLYCIDHQEEIAKGRCAISGEYYCEHCLTRHNDINMAKKYLSLYLDNSWGQVFMIPNNPGKKDMFDRLMAIKKDLWHTRSLPMIIQGHYKINVENDEIESYTVLLAREEDVPFIKSELSFIKE